MELRLPSRKPAAIEGLTSAELDRLLQAGLDSMTSGKSLSDQEVDRLLSEEFGL